MGSENGKVFGSKSSGCRAKPQGVVGGWKISHDNNVLQWGCCCRIESAAIQKRMRSCWSLKGRRQVRTQFWSWYSHHLFSRKFPSTNHVWTTWTRISMSFLHVQTDQILEWSIKDISLTFSDTTRLLTNRDQAPWVPPFSLLFFCGYWQFSLLGKNSLRLKCNA